LIGPKAYAAARSNRVAAGRQGPQPREAVAPVR
jgi:hypothetical protein